MSLTGDGHLRYDPYNPPEKNCDHDIETISVCDMNGDVVNLSVRCTRCGAEFEEKR